MDWTEVNGVALRYDLQGSSGPPVVLIHEMGGTLESWDDVVPLLVGRCRVLRYDVRGAGLSEKTQGTLDLDAVAGDLAALLDELGIADPVTVAGCAVGAAIAVHFTARHPGRVARVAALSPAFGIASADRAERLRFAEAIETTGPRAIADQSLGISYPAELRDRNPGRFASFRARWLANDPQSFAAAFRMLVALDLAADFAELACPVLLIAGSHDTVRGPAYVREVAKLIAGAEILVVDSGHHMPVQTPELVAAALLDFIPEAKSNDARRRAML
jgi:pimeloyl-ACP methyl ester carboxylesterase